MKITLRSNQNPLEADHWNEIQNGTQKLEGLTRHPTTTDKAGVVYDFPSFTFPEFGPARFYRDPNYPNHEVYALPKTFVAEIAGRRWKISLDTRYDDGFPERAEATFEETTEPETPFTTEDPRRTSSQIFGQPKFLQSEAFPHLNGKCACILAVIESGWGDAGNENLFLALDETGIPCGLYYEFSCC